MANLNIALGFSGGGFRAAAFNLGVLTYLHRIKINEKPLLENVVALSTVSGGTITGARYAVGIKHGETMEAIYEALYIFLSKEDLINLSLSRLLSKKGWNKIRVKSLINAFADVYDEYLFKHEKFGTLLNTDTFPIHLKHISFNATEFANALQFRFQISEKILEPKPDEPEKGIIGNTYFRLTDSVASEIRMADILAASSCFPAGFEPINFPTDFVLQNENAAAALNAQNGYPVGLMDGGIVDNQGIEPLLLANERMKRNRQSANPDRTDPSNAFDLIILSDVTSPYMTEYIASIQKSNWWKRFSPRGILIVISLVLIFALIALYDSYQKDLKLCIILSSVVVTASIIVFLLGQYIKSLPLKFQVSPDFLRPLGKLLRLKLFVYENLIMNRTNSVIKLAMDVFLKHVRRLNYKRVYEDIGWKNRRIMNAIYELRKGEKKLQDKIDKKTISPELIPSSSIQEAADKAASMGTTLWFTKDELQKDRMLDTIIACGQFTMCWNLLEYVQKLKKDPSNTNASSKLLVNCERYLMDDWAKFKNDPYFLINDCKSKNN